MTAAVSTDILGPLVRFNADPAEIERRLRAPIDPEVVLTAPKIHQVAPVVADWMVVRERPAVASFAVVSVAAERAEQVV